ncbi:quinone oxidoreductase [Colletotrichum phormii]|uniref:Quinone oxidoreductase n=1 Tax=Colletotrichum phormii TaxID=359342 RepID=A0AAJ0EA85_9PEZI|nr:quinone oxidoreductase [Colletotrichum phormii]KAK1622427.1 quinone oxidoreductase [Colletotrichum phormii]
MRLGTMFVCFSLFTRRTVYNSLNPRHHPNFLKTQSQYLSTTSALSSSANHLKGQAHQSHPYTMHAALVNTWGSPPTYTTVPDLPESSSTQIRLRVLATGVHRLVLSRASGKHYTASTLPHLPGADGVGEDPTTGQRYFFTALATGTFAEFVNVERAAVAPLPEGADAAVVAAFMNPVMSSWMALSARAAPQEKGFTVAILGVTSASGRVAVDIARAKGAGRIVGIARNAAAMEEIPIDERIVLNGGETDWSKLGEVDVVLDYVYGAPVVELLKALPKSEKEVQYVHIGSVSGDGDINLPGAILRGKRVALRGAGPGSWLMREYANELGGMVGVTAGLKGKEVKVIAMKDVEKGWSEAGLGKTRVVFVSDDLTKSS